MGILLMAVSLLAWCALPGLVRPWLQATLHSRSRGPAPGAEHLAPITFTCPSNPATPVKTTLTPSSHTLARLRNGQSEIAISPDGRRLARFSPRQVAMMNPATLATQRVDDFAERVVGYNADITLVMTYADPILTVWDIDRHAPQAVLRVGSYTSYLSALISNDGALVVLGNEVWDSIPYQQSTLISVVTDVWDTRTAARLHTRPERLLRIGPQDQSVLTRSPVLPDLKGAPQLNAYAIRTGEVMATYALAEPLWDNDTDPFYVTNAVNEPCVIMMVGTQVVGWDLSPTARITQRSVYCARCGRSRVFSATGRYRVVLTNRCTACGGGDGPYFPGPESYEAEVTIRDTHQNDAFLLVSRSSTWATTTLHDAIITPDERTLIVLTSAGDLARIDLGTGRIERSTITNRGPLATLAGTVIILAGLRWWRKQRRRRPQPGP
jgi:hypothetical protein